MYVTVDEVRLAGALPPEVTDEQIELSILKQQELIDRVTRQFFEVRSGELLLDGSGSDILHLPFPIIELEALYLNENEAAEPEDNYRVYAGRSKLQDDRRNPKIALYASSTDSIFTRRSVSSATGGSIFVKGRQNQKLVGQFGFVEPDDVSFASSIEADEGNTSPDEAAISGTPETRANINYELRITVGGIYGTFQAEVVRMTDNEVVLPSQTFTSGVPVAFDNGLSVRFIDAGSSSMTAGDKWYVEAQFDGTPRLVKHACTKLCLIKDFPDQSDVEESGVHGAIKREKTDGHEIEYWEISTGTSEFAGLIGDEEVAGILAAYKGPMLVSASTFSNLLSKDY